MCRQCELKPIYGFTNKRKLCKRCFIKYFQRKVFYTIRKFRMIKNGDVIGYKKNYDFRSVVLEDVLKILEGKMNIKLIKLSHSQTKLPNKIAISSSLDLEAKQIVKGIIEGNIKNQKINPFENSIIKPLYLLLDKEILLYAKLRNLKFKTEKEKKDKFGEFINLLERRHPEIKNAVAKGYLKIYDR